MTLWTGGRCPNCGFDGTPPSSNYDVYDCYLTYVGHKKIQAIKILRNYKFMGLKDAKDFIEEVGKVGKKSKLVAEAVSYDLAKEISAEFVEADCHIEIVRTNLSNIEMDRILSSLKSMMNQLQKHGD